MSLDQSPVKETASLIYKITNILLNQCAERSENLIVSPYLVVSTTAILLAGAKGKTVSQYEKALGETSDGITAEFKAIKGILTSLEGDDEEIYVKALGMFEENIQLLPDYEKKVMENFYEMLGTRDEDVLRGGMDKMPEQEELTRVITMFSTVGVKLDKAEFFHNAVILKGCLKWKYIKEDVPRKIDFPLDNPEDDVKHKAIQTLICEGEFSTLSIKELDDAKAVRIPFKGESVDMIFVLPNPNDTCDTFQEKLPSVDFSKIEFTEEETKMTLEIPFVDWMIEFDVDTSITKGCQPDFSGIMSDPMVGRAKQPSFSIYHAEDTVGGQAEHLSEMKYSDTLDFKADIALNRPHYFYIRERKNGIILFSGRLINPCDVCKDL